MEWITLICIFR